MIEVKLAFRDMAEVKIFENSEDAVKLLKEHEDKTILIDGLLVDNITEDVVKNAEDILVTIAPIGG